MIGISPPRGQTLRALWNLRALGLFLLGPVISVALGGTIFGMPTELIWAAGAMFLFSLTMFSIVVRGELRRIRRADRSRLA